jgi:molybdopterin molybdotransferase
MKPGKPLAFGASRGSQIPLVGLPGNPVSAFVSFWQFVSPALRKFLGQERLGLQRVEAVLTESVRSTPSRLDFQRGRAYLEGSRWRFVPFKGQGSGNPTSLVAVTGLAALPIGCSGAQAGETVEVQLLPGVLGGLF